MPECPLPEDFFAMSELEDYETGISKDCEAFYYALLILSSENENLTKFWESDWDLGIKPLFEDRTILSCKLRNHLMRSFDGLLSGNKLVVIKPSKVFILYRTNLHGGNVCLEYNMGSWVEEL